MVETWSQRKRKGEEDLEHPQDAHIETMRFGTHPNEQPNQNMGNPFDNLFLQDDEPRVIHKVLEATRQDPRVLRILDEMIVADPQSYFLRLLQNGTKLSEGVDINTLIVRSSNATMMSQSYPSSSNQTQEHFNIPQGQTLHESITVNIPPHFRENNINVMTHTSNPFIFSGNP